MFGVGAVNLTPTQRKAAMAAALKRRPAGPPPSPLTRGLGSRSLVPVNKAQAQANAVNKYTGLNLSGEEGMKTPPRSPSVNTNARVAFAPMPPRKEQGGSRRRGRKSTRRGRKTTRGSRKSTRRGRKSTRRTRRS